MPDGGVDIHGGNQWLERRGLSSRTAAGARAGASSAPSRAWPARRAANWAKGANVLAEAGISSGFVLICDEDPLLTALLEHRLGGHGYVTGVAHDREQAVAILGQITPDAFILGELIDVQSGQQVLRRIREDARLKDVPVIMLTARNQEADIVQALELGASDYVTKPFIPSELAARLAKAIRDRGG